MKILAVIGSPRTNGFTYRTVQALEREIVAVDPSVSFEYLQLSQVNLGLCKGCFQCLAKGEERCPLKDDRDMIETKMREADGILFSSPVYVCNVSGIMKNFIDRFAYRCHRPDFNGKKAMVVATTGAIGLASTLFALSFSVGTWGFSVVEKLGLAFDPNGIKENAIDDKKHQAIVKAARGFYRKLSVQRLPKPGLVKLIGFKLQRKAFAKASQDSPDYLFWKSKGWLEKGCKFYYPVRVGIVKNLIASLLNMRSV